MVSNCDGRLRAFIGDFGLTGKSGGTSIFMAPEGLDKDSRIIEKTDLYSFAVTVLFLMFPVDLTVKLLFLPISEDLQLFRKNLDRFQLLEMIFKSLRSDPEKRVDLQNWSIVFENMKTFEKNMLISKISSENLESEGIILNPLNKALENEGGFYYFILDFFGFEMTLSEVNKNEAWKMTTARSHMQNLSSIYCNRRIGILSKGST